MKLKKLKIKDLKEKVLLNKINSFNIICISDEDISNIFCGTVIEKYKKSPCFLMCSFEGETEEPTYIIRIDRRSSVRVFTSIEEVSNLLYKALNEYEYQFSVSVNTPLTPYFKEELEKTASKFKDLDLEQ